MAFWLIAPVALVGVVVVTELARWAVARAGNVHTERYPIKLMRLPADNGPRWARVGTIAIGPVALWLAITGFAFAAYYSAGEPGP